MAADSTAVYKTAVQNILTGRLQEVPELPRQTVKIYVCSNYSDFEVERTALLKDTFPTLQHHCLKYGLDLHWVDVHHGCKLDHAKDTHSFQRHLATMEECHRKSSGPFFICLLGSKYGDCPLPSFLDEAEFTHIRNEAFEGGKDIRLLDDWYIKDEYSVPVLYKLKPLQDVYKNIQFRSSGNQREHERNIEEWSATYTGLLDIIQYGAKIAHDEGNINQVHLQKQERFFTSAFEQEVTQALKLGCKEGVFIFRNIEAKDIQACFTDLDLNGILEKDKQERLSNLKCEVDSKISNSNKFTFTLQCDSKGISKDNSEHVAYLENLTAAVAMGLRDFFDEHEKNKLHFPSTKKGELCLETLIHLHHCKELMKVYHGGGLDFLLSKIQMLLMNGTRIDHPLIIVKGDAGCGKSLFLSKICFRARELFGKDMILISRFIGITPKSKDKQQILREICVQLNFVLQQNICLEEYDGSHLTNYFYGLANRISKGQRHLVLVLDGVDNLESNDKEETNYMIDWFSIKLPPKVHLIISYRPGKDHAFQKLEAKTNNAIDSMVIFPGWTHDRIEEALTFNLSKNKRVMAKNKEKLFIKLLLKASPFVIQNALKLLKDWHVNYNFINNHFPISNEEIVHKHLDQLEFTFGTELVEAMCRYFTLSNFGLSESELLDILSCNNDVILSVLRYSNSEVFRFPWFLWIYLKSEIGLLLSQRFVHRKIVLCWSHDFVEDIVRRRYMANVDSIGGIHSDLTELFLETWTEGKQMLIQENSLIEDDIQRYVCHQPLLYSETKYNNRKINELWIHLLQLGDAKRLKEHALCNFEYLLSMIDSSSINTVLQNFRLTLSRLVDAEVFLIYNCLLKSCPVLAKHPTQLANELIGYLRDIKDFYPCFTESLVTQSMQWCDTYNEPLFIPMTSWLPSPHLPLVATMDGLDGANLIAPLHNNQHILCSYGLLDIGMYHVPSKKLLKLFSGHRSSIRCLILSNKEQFCISGSEDGTVRFWKFAEGLCTSVIREHLGAVLCLCMTPEDDVVISGSDDTTIVLSSVSTGKRTDVLKGHTKAVTALKLNSNADLLSSASRDTKIIVWCMKEKTQLLTVDDIHSPISCMDLTSDNTFLLAGCEDGSLNVISFTTGSWIHQLKGHKGWVRTLTLADNCHHVFAGCQDNMVYMFNFRTTELIDIFQGHNSAVTHVRISNDQSMVFSSSEGKINLWSFLPKLTNNVENDDHTCIVTCVAITTDAKIALSGATDGEIKLWDLEMNIYSESFLGHSGAITCIEPSSRTAFTVTAAEDKTIKVWSMTLATVIVSYEKHENFVRQMKILGDDMRIVSYDILGHFHLWRADEGTTLMTFDRQASTFILSTDCQLLITARGDNCARVWKTDSGTLVTGVSHTERITCLCCDIKDRFLVTGSEDKSCKVWDLTTGKLTQVLVEHSTSVIRVAINSDGSAVISGANDGCIMVWEISSGECRHKLNCHTMCITALNFLSNEQFVISSSKDGTIRLWDVQLGLHVTMIDMHFPVLNYVLSEDCCKIVVHLENSKHVPLLCLHNCPEPSNALNSQPHFSYTDRNEDISPILPIHPKISSCDRYSIVYPIPQRPEPRDSGPSPLPEIIQLSPIRAPHKTVFKKTNRPQVKININREKRRRNTRTQESVLCIII
ncbi:protein qui-1-like [Saccostrea echinata]|uniref:protein qui-1-like n=1 Tax=Saccostrea echinata TaxID=191078 RepID=UPI002A7F160F|nr:protein qui-1-like [Saccostrea echinata]